MVGTDQHSVYFSTALVTKKKGLQQQPEVNYLKWWSNWLKKHRSDGAISGLPSISDDVQ
jgi:hypothetical protein